MDVERVGLLFPGQGAQAPGMGRALYERSATARRVMDRAAELLGYDSSISALTDRKPS